MANMQTEKNLAKKMGLPQERLAAARKAAAMQEGIDWDTVGGTISYSDTGVHKLCEALGVPQCAPELELKADKAPAPAPAEDAVVKKFFVNPRLFEAELVRTKFRVKVRVSSAKNLQVGMVVPVRPAGDVAGLYDLARRAPRAFGRW